VMKTLGKARQKGQTLVLTALILPLVILPFLFGAIDSSYTLVAWGQISQDVFLGARAGASDINTTSLYGSNPQYTLNVTQAEKICEAYVKWNASQIPGIASTPNPTCVVRNPQNTTQWYVVATVKVTLKLPFPSFINNSVSASSTAEMQYGVNIPIN
jgi:hypothetical protein